MNFFESQDQARKSTTRLVFFFLLAIVSLVVLTNVLVMFVFGYLDSEVMTADSVMANFDWATFGMVGLGVLAVIMLGSFYKIASLSGGGATIADMMGGQLVANGGKDLHEQKILNVVEEMAIASGTPVPPVYILAESGINAFAAGFKPSDAVIGITRGAIEQLSRPQLQGVIAHEFSHILHGDMRLNIRLMGVLHGILVIGMIGYYVLRVTGFSGGSRRSSKGKDGAPIFVLGLGLIALGFAGTFFGNIIKAAVSRQREYLADASAVQYTRNPDGIADALKRIGGSKTGAILDNPNTAEISHCLFGEGVSTFMGSLWATHPPLEKRIRRMQPNWDGKFLGPVPVEPAEKKPAKAAKSGGFDAAIAGLAVASQIDAIGQIGNPEKSHIDYAHALIEALPEQTKSAVHEPYGARAVIYALLLDKDTSERQKQLDHLQQHADDGVFELTVGLHQELSSIDRRFCLPLIEMAFPALRQLSKSQYQLFKRNLQGLIEMDNKVSLFEWSVRKIVLKHLDAALLKHKNTGYGRKSLHQLRDACAVLLSVLAYADGQANNNPQKEFDAARQAMQDDGLQLVPRKDISLAKLDTALEQLNALKPLQKPQLLKACAASITADEKISPVEAELFRAIADTLDCPMPPLVV